MDDKTLYIFNIISNAIMVLLYSIKTFYSLNKEVYFDIIFNIIVVCLYIARTTISVIKYNEFDE